ncbi:MAG: hypothetical protein K9K38_13150 [Rhodoferax sp.]|nr:hypothetical protein [Rhodoferax sp.]MCF8210326.1 hypothetical protein [Rhodoferax sp.]
MKMLVHQLAAEFGLNVAPARLERIGHGYHTFRRTEVYPARVPFGW